MNDKPRHFTQAEREAYHNTLPDRFAKIYAESAQRKREANERMSKHRNETLEAKGRGLNDVC